MAAIFIKIISILGIVLLSLLGVILAAVLLILFLPVHYKATGKKQGKDIFFSFRASWLFRLLQVRFVYPESGQLSATFLGFPVYQKNLFSKTTDEHSTEKAGKQTTEENEETIVTEKEQPIAKAEDVSCKTADQEKKSEKSNKETKDKDSVEKAEGTAQKNDAANDSEDNTVSKIQKIIVKIKKLLSELDFYKTLLQDEETKALFAHAFKRLGLICRHVRPRKIKADILFGTGSPDTTGYVFGIYGMLMPHLGKNVYVTPDFTQQILQGEFYLKGHITVFTVLINSLKLLLDKKLRIFINRIKRHQNKSKS